jgi:hypothetical protein
MPFLRANLHGTAVLDGDDTRSASGLVDGLALHLLDDILALENLAENDVTTVKVGGLDEL